MPTVPKTSRQRVLREARALVVKDGVAALTMSALARRCGVRAPSLYGHFANRAAIITALAIDELKRLETNVRKKAAPARADSAALVARLLRSHAKANPHVHALLFATQVELTPEFTAVNASATLAVCEHVAAAMAVRDVTAPAVLSNARLLVAFTNGFVSMELAGAFRMGGDVDEAFERGVRAIVSTFRAKRA